jgi:uncharacterized membrane-anchored protein
LICAVVASFIVTPFAYAIEGAESEQPASAAQPPAAETAYLEKIKALKWVKGPTTVAVVGDSKLVIPEGYLFLDQAETSKFLELNQNLSDGSEMMLAPDSLRWTAYFSFADEGYVKDNEKIDAPELLSVMQKNTEASNAERRRRGWSELHLTGWASPPAYNSSTKRLEWATRLQSSDGSDVNFFTKILGRKGHTTVILVTSPEGLATSRPQLDAALTGYNFNAGSRYSEFVPGDKVAEYGLAALILGGAAAVATKKGFWAIIAGFLATAWKFLIAAFVAAAGALRKLFGKKSADA